VDSFGHVNNAAYLNYLEAARGDALIQAGLSFHHFEEWSAFPVVRRARLDFLAPLFSDDEIRIESEMTPLRRTGFHAHQKIIRTSTGTLALDAELELVFTSRAGRPIAVPELFKERFL